MDATMVFKRLLGSLGVGAPTVDTVLDPAPVLPGGTLTGQVHLQGGQADFDIEHVTLELVARVEAEHEDGESEGAVVFDRFTVGGGFRLGAEEPRSVPFRVTLPWETPITELYGQPLGIVLGVRTELAVAG
ncbi:sporulation protein, partial [Streptomyces sp. SID5926]|nr:sporulation protein [Streptomyces sp. SID5926]